MGGLVVSICVSKVSHTYKQAVGKIKGHPSASPKSIFLPLCSNSIFTHRSSLPFFTILLQPSFHTIPSSNMQFKALLSVAMLTASVAAVPASTDASVSSHSWKRVAEDIAVCLRSGSGCCPICGL